MAIVNFCTEGENKILEIILRNPIRKLITPPYYCRQDKFKIYWSFASSFSENTNYLRCENKKGSIKVLEIKANIYFLFWFVVLEVIFICISLVPLPKIITKISACIYGNLCNK